MSPVSINCLDLRLVGLRTDDSGACVVYDREFLIVRVEDIPVIGITLLELLSELAKEFIRLLRTWIKENHSVRNQLGLTCHSVEHVDEVTGRPCESALLGNYRLGLRNRSIHRKVSHCRNHQAGTVSAVGSSFRRLRLPILVSAAAECERRHSQRHAKNCDSSHISL